MTVTLQRRHPGGKYHPKSGGFLSASVADKSSRKPSHFPVD
jgi:hypothetical protein